MGYYTEYFSTLMKSDWALALKERWDSKRVIKYSQQVDKLIYKTMPQLVKAEHRVTEALKKEEMTISDLKEVAKYGLHLAFNSAFQDEHIFKTIHHIIEIMRNIEESVVNMKKNSSISAPDINKRMIVNLENELESLSQQFAIMISRQSQKAEKETREEMKDVMNLITQSHTMTHEDFMTAVREKFQSLKSQTYLARFAFRFDVQHEKSMLAKLGAISVQLEHLKRDFENILKNLDKKYRDLPGKVKEFKVITQQSKKYIEGAFFYSYKIKKRDFNVMLNMMVNMDVLTVMDNEWIRLHFMPEAPTREKIDEIREIEKKMSEKLNVVAQSLRISISAEEDMKNQALPLLKN